MDDTRIDNADITTSESGNVTFTPWTDGFAVGFMVTNKVTGKVRYIYLNPSTDCMTDKGGDDGTVFLYLDDTGNSADGMTVTWLNTMED